MTFVASHLHPAEVESPIRLREAFWQLAFRRDQGFQVATLDMFLIIPVDIRIFLPKFDELQSHDTLDGN